jgi:hypothetical protein
MCDLFTILSFLFIFSFLASPIFDSKGFRNKGEVVVGRCGEGEEGDRKRKSNYFGLIALMVIVLPSSSLPPSLLLTPFPPPLPTASYRFHLRLHLSLYMRIFTIFSKYTYLDSKQRPNCTSPKIATRWVWCLHLSLCQGRVGRRQERDFK